MAKPRPVPVASPAPARSGNLKAAALLFLATLFAYLPSFRGEIIWNDSDYVTAPELRSLSGLGIIWTKLGATEQYYPLLHSFFWLQHQLWGDHTFGYHLVTLLLHSAGAILFALVLQRLAIPGAWIAALIFALHPVHVESVAWITEQKNTLSIVFYLLAALLYLRFDQTRSPRTYAFAFTWFVLSLLCKTVTASLPAALLVAFWWKRGRLDWRRDFQPLIPWLAAGAAVGLLTSWVEQHFLGAKGQDFNLPLLERGLIAGRAIWFYLGNLIWPFNLNFIYPRWVPDHTVWWQWLFPLGVFTLLFGLWAFRHRSRAPLAAFLFFIGSLFPVLGFVNLYGALYSFVWDHWQYLPDLGPIALAAAGLALAWERLAPRLRGMGPLLVSALAVFLGALTWAHCGMFHDDITLYRETLRRNPGAWMAHFNQGGILLKIPGQEEAAMAEYNAALRINPNLADAHYDIGTVLAKMPGREEEAISHFQTALRIAPENGAIHYNLGNLLMKMPGRMPDAIAQFREAVRLSPNLAEARYNLGIALISDPQLVPEAITHLEAALRLKEFPLARQIIARWHAAQRQ